MMTKEEIRAWVDSLPAGAQVGIDDGGLCLRVFDPAFDNNYDEDGPWMEIGGLPPAHVHRKLTAVEAGPYGGLMCNYARCIIPLRAGDDIVEVPSEGVCYHERCFPEVADVEPSAG